MCVMHGLTVFTLICLGHSGTIQVGSIKTVIFVHYIDATVKHKMRWFLESP